MHALKRAGIAWAIGVLVLGLTLVFVGSHSAHGATRNPHHEEQDGCDHGHTGKTCRPDPQPTHGKDCVKHGKHGGINEDHCKVVQGVPTPRPTPTSTPKRPPHSTTRSSKKPSIPLARTGSEWLVWLGVLGLSVMGLGVILRRV